MNRRNKATFFLVLAATMLMAAFPAALFAQNAAKPVTLKVGANPIPHADLLNLVKADLLAQGIKLEIVEITDYVTPNLLLAEKQIDANFFQHTPYLVNFASERKLALEPAGQVFVAPLGLYSRKYKKLGDIPSGAVITIPNDPTNEARALILFQNKGLIKLDPNAGLKATIRDITENSKKFVFKEIEAPQLPRTLDDAAAAVINGSFATQAGFFPARDNLMIEGAESPYANILATRKGDANDWRVVALLKALQTEKVRAWLNGNYNGSFVPAF
ncbi:MAG: MetQ/NlpA family ABC transporter substrate-binding protein [Rectinemataceae bacterium]|nr:MetQ/NlpA family ABC transporter substrate-binding protein [Rectinemataceae bacterium]